MSLLPERPLCALVAAMVLAAAGMVPAVGAPEVSLRVWETDEGLPHNGVNAMVQAPDRFLWLATQSGLARFDGLAFAKIRSPLLAGNQTLGVRSVIQEDAGSMLIANDASGLLRMREGKLTAHPLAEHFPSGQRPTRLFREADGVFWIVFASRELWRCAGEKVEKFPPRERGMEAHWPLSFAVAGDGTAYIGRGNGLEAYAPGGLQEVPGFPQAATTVAPARDGGLWVATAARLVKFRDGIRETVIEGADWPGDWPPQALHEDRRGTLWIGTKSQGLFRWEDGRLWPVQTSYPRINCLLEDDEGNLWVGTSGGGLNRVQRARFALMGEAEGVMPDNVGSLSEDADGNLWFGNRNTFGVLRNGRLEVPPITEVIGRRAFPICHDAEGQMWIAVGARLARWNCQTGGEPQWLPVDIGTIHVIFRGRDGAIWVAGESGPLLRFSGGKETRFGPEQGFHGAGAQAIAEAPNGDLWAGTSAGELFRLRGGRFERQGADFSAMGGSAIRALHIDAAGLVWAGTGGAGLAIGRDGKFAVVTEQQGLPDDTISQLIEDDGGVLWMGSSRGLFKARKRALLDCADGRTARVAPVLFGKADGLAGFSASANYQPSVYKGKDGKLWFASRKGVVMVQANRASELQGTLQASIESAAADGHALQGAGPRVASPIRKLEFHFTAPSFTSPETARFRHRLIGLDSAWSDPSTERVASYARVPPGRYVFEVMAGASDLTWSAAPTPFAFEVLPAWWETWWARAGAILLGVSATAALVRHWSQRRLKAKLMELEHRRRIDMERTRIARDLHDSLGASLTQAGLLAEELCEDCHDPREMREHSAQLAGRVRAIARDLDAAVWAVSPKDDSLASLCAYLCQFALEFFRHGPTRCRVLVGEEIPPAPLSPEVRHHLFLSAREALNNVSKHARAREVQVGMGMEDGAFVLTVRDDGLGFAGAGEGESERHGLRNMRERMAEAGGRFEVETSSEGTLVRLILPVPARAAAPPMETAR